MVFISNISNKAYNRPNWQEELLDNGRPSILTTSSKLFIVNFDRHSFLSILLIPFSNPKLDTVSNFRANFFSCCQMKQFFFSEMLGRGEGRGRMKRGKG